MTERTLIIGGSTGIGKKIAAHLLAQGHEVIISSSSEGKLTQASDTLEGDKLYALRCDVTRASDVVELAAKLARERLVPRTVIVAAAILGPVGKFGENDFAQWRRAIEVDLIGNAAAVHAFLPLLLAQERPKLILFGGGGAAYSRPMHTAYATAKTGMVRLAEILADEYKGQLDVNIIAPGAHLTPMWDTETHDKPPAQWADDAKLFALIDWLVSPASDGISGRFIHIENEYREFTPEITGSDRYVLRRTK